MHVERLQRHNTSKMGVSSCVYCGRKFIVRVFEGPVPGLHGKMDLRHIFGQAHFFIVVIFTCSPYPRPSNTWVMTLTPHFLAVQRGGGGIDLQRLDVLKHLDGRAWGRRVRSPCTASKGEDGERVFSISR